MCTDRKSGVERESVDRGGRCHNKKKTIIKIYYDC